MFHLVKYFIFISFNLIQVLKLILIKKYLNLKIKSANIKKRWFNSDWNTVGSGRPNVEQIQNDSKSENDSESVNRGLNDLLSDMDVNYYGDNENYYDDKDYYVYDDNQHLIK